MVNFTKKFSLLLPSPISFKIIIVPGNRCRVLEEHTCCREVCYRNHESPVRYCFCIQQNKMSIIIAIYHLLVFNQSRPKYFTVELLISNDCDHLNSFNFEAIDACAIQMLNTKHLQTSSVQKYEANNLLIYSFIFVFCNIKCILLHKSTTKLNFKMM